MTTCADARAELERLLKKYDKYVNWADLPESAKNVVPYSPLTPMLHWVDEASVRNDFTAYLARLAPSPELAQCLPGLMYPPVKPTGSPPVSLASGLGTMVTCDVPSVLANWGPVLVGMGDPPVGKICVEIARIPGGLRVLTEIVNAALADPHNYTWQDGHWKLAKPVQDLVDASLHALPNAQIADQQQMINDLTKPQTWAESMAAAISGLLGAAAGVLGPAALGSLPGGGGPHFIDPQFLEHFTSSPNFNVDNAQQALHLAATAFMEATLEIKTAVGALGRWNPNLPNGGLGGTEWENILAICRDLGVRPPETPEEFARLNARLQFAVKHPSLMRAMLVSIARNKYRASAPTNYPEMPSVSQAAIGTPFISSTSDDAVSASYDALIEAGDALKTAAGMTSEAGSRLRQVVTGLGEPGDAILRGCADLAGAADHVAIEAGRAGDDVIATVVHYMATDKGWASTFFGLPPSGE